MLLKKSVFIISLEINFSEQIYRCEGARKRFLASNTILTPSAAIFQKCWLQKNWKMKYNDEWLALELLANDLRIEFCFFTTASNCLKSFKPFLVLFSCEGEIRQSCQVFNHQWCKFMGKNCKLHQKLFFLSKSRNATNVQSPIKILTAKTLFIVIFIQVFLSRVIQCMRIQLT